ncbi:MAG: Lrp/AsnC family transcriptional regulator [Brevundimonas sp.]|uniref:Lrp/AsnC family transcriptional regulator n=1 Tax=Brevundimonas sp. TaxID=1871086 RepID=UPI000DB6A3F5|nr:Lrp/AsnC family transcriptional regulator [Brevundimonas sp.]PZU00303.1 MAG: Lrp/AsnC family transcriptional regulator [Brevundimonas sp.]
MADSNAAPRRSRGRKSDGEAGDQLVLDEIDERIIAVLRRNSRASYSEVARTIGANEATVRSRTRRLEDERVLRLIALRDLRAMGFEALAAVGVEVKGRSALDVGQDLARHEQITTVNVTVGFYDLEIQVIARDLKELETMLTTVVAKTPGVARVYPALALNVLKYNPEWAPL